MRTPSRRVSLLVLFVAAPALASGGAPPVATAPPAKLQPHAPQFPPGVKAMGDKLVNGASAAVRAWASQHAPAVAHGPGDPDTLARTAAHARWPNLRPAGVYDALTFLVIYEAAEVLVAQIKQTLDSKSELGETESLRLQMAMDRVSKMMNTLSNLLQKISDSEAAITRNLK